ncbi:HNH endonuclease [Pseudomonas sp. S 311-6]|uniref:HNH endonuclease n=1 Tax=Pseudomonas TaxID=286 RepID=UPI002096819C|nr:MULTISPECIES: HNH endonuclease [Pseudomonas]MCO7640735.1 HNH endonuclease [Pseudomonas sp. S 311-6]MCO7566429.1 HNH endonuclease [Pseudomonas mosselii]MCO7595044.1 HNH endonuclease [Pseudomonas guariconensis]MCO7617457.1 HNH endonuclease [Pseudomonas guariconensis]MCU7221076.1 HNH endonuclease [Pseudomonas brassicacearum]
MQLNSARQAWRPVVGFESTHMVSDLGVVMTLDQVVVDSLGRSRPVKGRILKPTRKSNGYYHLTLNAEGQQKTVHVHRIVLEAFSGPCPEGMEALHRNGDQGDNRLENLRWDFHVENCADRSRHGRCQHKLSFEQVKEIKALIGTIRQVDIAERFGVSQPVISAIKLGRIWYTDREAA